MMNNLADARRRETSEVQQNLQAVEIGKGEVGNGDRCSP